MSVKQRLNQHQQRTANDEHQPQCRFFRQLFVEYEVRERDGHKDTQLVDRHYHAGRAVLQRLVVAQPTPAGGKAGQYQKQQRFSADVSDGILRADDEHHQPRKGQHYYGADGAGHGGIRLADAAFAKIAVRPANSAEPKADNIHMIYRTPFLLRSLCRPDRLFPVRGARQFHRLR